MRSLLNLKGSKIFKYQDFTEEEQHAVKVEEPPYLTFSDEDLIVKRKKPQIDEEPAGTDAEGESEIPETVQDPVASLAEKAINSAALEADRIINEAGEKAKAILEKSADEAEKIVREAEARAGELFAGSKEEGYSEGYAQGLIDGGKEGKEQARSLSEEKLKSFITAVDASCENIDLLRDETLEKYLKDLTELVLTIAEKIVCVSLESSSEVIKKMIQQAAAPAVDKQWAKVTISAEDARKMSEEGIDIREAISAISEKIDLNIVDDAALGTCLVEFPDQVIDAGAGTQLRNIKDIVRGADTE